MAASAPFVVTAVGFGSGGVVAGTIAALWQSFLGAVAKGSLFAFLQSVGATGAAAGWTGTGAAVGATAMPMVCEARRRVGVKNE